MGFLLGDVLGHLRDIKSFHAFIKKSLYFFFRFSFHPFSSKCLFLIYDLHVMFYRINLFGEFITERKYRRIDRNGKIE